jgi:hypothetical protein
MRKKLQAALGNLIETELIPKQGFHFDQEWYTPKEIGEILKVSSVSVARLFRDQAGVIDVAVSHESNKHNREHLRIPAETLQRFLRSRNVA